MDYREPAEELKKIILPLLEEEGAEIVELNFIRMRGKSLLKLLVDRKCGGISLGDCSRLNQKIGEALDAADTIKESYVLEVSSPGLDRPLKTKNDFLRCINKKVKFFLCQPVNGKIEINARVDRAEDEAVVVDIEGKTQEIPLSNIIKAKQII